MASDDSNKVRCKSCDRKYTWAEKYAGKKVRCKCGEAIRFPKEPPANEVESLELELNLDSGIDLNLNDPPPTTDAAPNAGAMDLALDLNTHESSSDGCPHCGAPVRPGAVLCVGCGYHFQNGTQTQTQLDAPAPDPKAAGFSGGAGRGRSSGGAAGGAIYEGPVDGFFGRFARSWQFAKISYSMLWDFKQLVLFPIFSAIAATLVFLSFLLPAWGLGLLQVDLSTSEEPAVVLVAQENTPTDATAQPDQAFDTAATAMTHATSKKEAVDAMKQMATAVEANAAAQKAAQSTTPQAQASEATAITSVSSEANADSRKQILQGVFAFGFYFCNYFVIVFFNTALIACAMKVVAGEAPTMGYGIQIALKRLPQIFMWSLLSAVVGVVLKIIENSHEKAGAIIAAILGTGWTVLTYFVVPVIAVEGTGPLKSIKQSVTTLKATWGESIMGNFSMGLLTFIVTLPVYLILAVGFYVALSLSSMPLFAVMLVVTIFSIVVIAATSSAADIVFKSLLYNYASGRALPQTVDSDMFAAAFAAPRKKGWFK